MAQFTVAQIQQHAEKVMEALKDGFQITDLFTIIPQVMEIVEQVQGMTGAEKHATVKAILDYVIDNTDCPWIPDALVDPLLKKAVDHIIPMIVKASKGDFDLNKNVG